MPTSPYFPSYYGGTTGEQGLVQDLVDEQIKLFGTDIYYLPRTLITDGVLDDVIYNKFESQFQVEMLLQNVEGFGSPSEFISKFGLRITDEVRFVVSQRRWEEAASSYTLTVPGRPNEGDLLYFPLTQDIYEIKFVEREDPFYQLGKIYFYTMTAEIYEYGSDDISTGVDEIDVLETIMSPAILMFMDPGGIGNFTVGEEVVGDEFLAKAIATTDGDAVDSINVSDSGSYYVQSIPPTVTISGGGGSGATATASVSSTGLVTDILITNGGSGYTSAPTVTIDYSPKDNRAEVKSWDAATRKLEIINRTGTFTTAETVTGLTSGAKWSPESYDTLNNTNSEYDQNREIEDAADNIIDWTEGNPFGEAGNYIGSI
ncbi:neck protein [Synechococcus phage S-H9-2]|uniref:Neck protein n=1 Tax=Synechococcus phage S-H9-2 TaxID=2783669 RepID=A0A873WT67_9CAUD|nr:virion structural protein [Synechococcus phage S-H9-2]QPB08304.1 neck protein [Synechococcus phage S-H9-2]